MTTAYVFLHRRPTDKQAWPVIYQDRNAAEACKFRVSELVPVELPVELPVETAPQSSSEKHE